MLPAPEPRSRPYRNPYGFGVADKIVDNEIIVHIAHGFDGVQLIFQPLPDSRGRRSYRNIGAEPS